jgi:hypothetical protein
MPFHAIELRDFPTSETGGGFRAWLVLLILDVDRLVAWLPFVALKDEGARTGEVRNLRVWVRFSHTLRHHEGNVGGGLAQSQQDEASRLLELYDKGLCVFDLDVRHKRYQLLPASVLGRPALDRSHAVLGCDRLTIVPEQAIAKREGVRELVGRRLVLVDHLRLDLALLVGREQRVVDHVAVVADDVGGRPDRIQDFQIRVHHGSQRFLRVCRRGKT